MTVVRATVLDKKENAEWKTQLALIANIGYVRTTILLKWKYICKRNYYVCLLQVKYQPEFVAKNVWERSCQAICFNEVNFVALNINGEVQ